jgi:arsenical pump membrane protein
MTPDVAKALTVAIILVAGAGVLARPWRTSEAIWAVGGAVLLAALGLLPLADVWRAIGEGGDVYLFLAGMMLLSEVARREGLFDAVAAFAVNRASGSAWRLFALVYGAGVVITVFMSNDATAVVLTPAVFAAARRAKTEPLPHLFACAFIANAASFVLPISNPANLVLYADHTPPLAAWLARFALPSAAAIVATFAALAWAERGDLNTACESAVPVVPITRGGWVAVAGLGCTVTVLLVVSALDRPLGLPTAIMGALTAAVVLIARRASPLPLLLGISWSILPLVAGLFVMVAALRRIGAISALAGVLRQVTSQLGSTEAGGAAGALVAFVCNLVNNLPAGLVASAASAQAQSPRNVIDALMIGVDLGPNLSVTGSLATILWLAAIRREGEHVSAWRFLKTGVIVMPPALLLALAARLALP